MEELLVLGFGVGDGLEERDDFAEPLRKEIWVEIGFLLLGLLGADWTGGGGFGGAPGEPVEREGEGDDGETPA